MKHGLSAMPVPEVPSHLSQIYRRLEQEEMTLDVEKKVLYLKDHIEKTAQQRTAAAKQKTPNPANLNETNSIYNLSDIKAAGGNLVEARTAALDAEITSTPSTSISHSIDVSETSSHKMIENSKSNELKSKEVLPHSKDDLYEVSEKESNLNKEKMHNKNEKLSDQIKNNDFSASNKTLISSGK